MVLKINKLKQRNPKYRMRLAIYEAYTAYKHIRNALRTECTLN